MASLIIAARHDLRYLRGDSFDLVFAFKTASGSVVDFTGSTFLMKIIAIGDTNKTAIISFSTGAGLTLNTTTGTVTLSKTPAQMASLTAGNYLYELQETDTNSKVKTRIRGYFECVDDITL